MSVTKSALAPYNKDNSWLATIATNIAASGLVQTADTGQMSTSSPTAYNTTGNTIYGYWIFRFNDSAQSTRPIYIKFSWQNAGTSSTRNVQLVMTVGTGSDGAGTITGIVVGPNSIYSSSSTTADATLWDTYTGGDGSGFIFTYGMPAATDSRQFFVIDRYRDSTGTANDRGFYIWNTVAAATVNFSHVKVDGVTATACVSGNLYFLPNTSTSTSQLDSSGNLPIFPIAHCSPDYERSLMIVGHNSDAIGRGGEFQVNHLGATRNFVSLGNSVTGFGSSMSGATESNSRVAFLYE